MEAFDNVTGAEIIESARAEIQLVTYGQFRGDPNPGLLTLLTLT